MAVTNIITLLGLFGFIPGTYTANSDGALIERVEALEKRLQLSEGNIFTLQETIQRKDETIRMLQSNLQQADTNDNSLALHHKQQIQLDKLTVKLKQQQEQLDRHDFIIQQQQTQLDQQNQKIQQQQEQIDQQSHHLQQQLKQIDQQRHDLQQQEERILNLEAELEKYNLGISNDGRGEKKQSIGDVNDVPDGHGNNTNRTMKVKKTSGFSRRQVEGGGIAFTAYLDHDVELGTDQIIQFNQVITNEAEAYSVHTGVFTCPESGLYMFSFSVGERDSGQIWADLRVNSALKTSATAETKENTEDNQGSSTVVIRLTIGDKVWVSGRDTHHVEGNAGFRVTTFTGVYLYP